MKEENDVKTEKRQAFMSFLESSTNQSELFDKKNNSDNEEVYVEEYTDETNCCGVCGQDVPESKKKKNCAFCNLVTCADHLRKKRRKKNKWEKICDNCEDKMLYDSYMKLQVKAEEALGVEEQIVKRKHQSIVDLLEAKRIKRREVSFKGEQLKNDQYEKMKKLTTAQNRLQSISNKLESEELTCKQIEQYIRRIEKEVKENYQEDYHILVEEDVKMGKELARIEKRCQQTKIAIQKRQKQFEEAYDEWEKRQYRKSLSQQTGGQKKNSKDNCSVF